MVFDCCSDGLESLYLSLSGFSSLVVLSMVDRRGAAGRGSSTRRSCRVESASAKELFAFDSSVFQSPSIAGLILTSGRDRTRDQNDCAAITSRACVLSRCQLHHTIRRYMRLGRLKLKCSCMHKQLHHVTCYVMQSGALADRMLRCGQRPGSPAVIDRRSRLQARTQSLAHSVTVIKCSSAGPLAAAVWALSLSFIVNAYW
jgi:hypothetical protein